MYFKLNKYHNEEFFNKSEKRKIQTTTQAQKVLTKISKELDLPSSSIVLNFNFCKVEILFEDKQIKNKEFLKALNKRVYFDTLKKLRSNSKYNKPIKNIIEEFGLNDLEMPPEILFRSESEFKIRSLRGEFTTSSFIANDNLYLKFESSNILVKPPKGFQEIKASKYYKELERFKEKRLSRIV
ncbi:MAG: hypothetical protein N4A54_09590 [Peptostreptococcaceae bacterium]|jgi:hypothetical protein|nr:hypothetical protein [Peptostreptococcaceae bacterium]